MWGHLRRRDHGRAVLAGEASAAVAEAALAPLERGAGAGAAAFFDVDNTLMRGASIYHFARGLASRDLFTTRDLARFAWGQTVFRVTGSEQAGHINAAREAALAFVAGHKVADLVELCEEIYDDTMADRIWEGARVLVQRHLDAGQRVWLVTATPVELADIIKRRLGLSGALGTVAESVDGVYTGRLVGDLLHGPAKAEAVRALAAHEKLDLDACTAYSDSHNDLPLLSAVGHPNVVNPDDLLRAHAVARRWPVHEFRRHRRALRVGVPAAVAGALVGGVAVGIARRRRGG
ncbi:HAD superfamily hydrolase (TIGR01490 family) [Murinocardiopsis flavida]|uniref:HAD superfamily hydrolase (TIGR01490 family) n=1 Tax=Murinocardiopsis flavida TaxID=645275 RepID=A0A2P8DQV8_9ACTN|nr:HAD-IB family hydrolase [Murinocardiopsis flavida]PSK99608.1 HAD superfamily hydrolase (TIGR01490 family) [Murinocardiopsis flavida]